jgi:hypothetical protein
MDENENIGRGQLSFCDKCGSFLRPESGQICDDCRRQIRATSAAYGIRGGDDLPEPDDDD